MKRNYDKITKDIIELYNNGKSISSICKIVEVCIPTASKILKKAGIRYKRGRRVKNTFNDNYFNIIDCKEKAYFLGLLYADGNIYLKRKRLQLTLQEKDSYIIEKLSNEMEYKGKLYIDRKIYTKLIIGGSDKLIADLIRLGCIPKKSSVLKFPTDAQVPKKFIWHFIRGYFDGDGSISSIAANINFTSTRDFLNVLKRILLENNIEMSEFKPRYMKDNSSGTIYCCTQSKAAKLFKLLYKDSTNLRLERKYLKMKKYENC